jgi:hypothetical protein
MDVRVKMKDDSPASGDEFFWRKGDIGTIANPKRNGGGIVDFNGIEGQAVLDDGKWFAFPPLFEVLE